MLSPIKKWAGRYWNSFSFVGLVFATLFFAASVTPSLVPRPWVAQGLLSGSALAVGYSVGVFLLWFWQLLELPKPTDRLDWYSKRISTIGAFLVFVWFSWRMTWWQNSIRSLMDMPPLESVHTWRIVGLALVWGAFLIALVRALVAACHFGADQLNRIFPRRLSYAISAALVGFCFLFLLNDVLAASLMATADDFFAELDELIEEDVIRPSEPDACGSAVSHVAWGTIGRQGKSFLTGSPTIAEMQQLTGRPARRPIRVYVGYRSADTHETRAELALRELIRVGAFQRSVLVVATPTGTGWLDPSAVDPLEYLHGGDTAIVATQYSYLPSWMTLLVDSQRSIESARALFDEVYSYWKTLPHDERPALYLHGLSLGALGSEVSADLFTILEDPIQGAVWSGPPFPSSYWAQLTRGRNSDSPAWLPTFRDGAMVRFTAQQNSLDPSVPWGPYRCVYIQYASDPMVFFSPDLLFEQPEWLTDDRGPDVSPELRWLPIITCLQVVFDLPLATNVPLGFGHNYAPSSYIDAWVAVTSPPDWTDEDTERLKQLFDRLPEPDKPGS